MFHNITHCRSAGTSTYSGDWPPQHHPPSTEVESSIHSESDGLQGGHHWPLEMESPLPCDLSVSRDNLSSTSNETWSLPGHSREFFFPRFSFPVWLSVRGENPVGLGAPSPPLQYYPPYHCTRLKGALLSLSAMYMSVQRLSYYRCGVGE